jgi:lysophospholipase L1-like esterase
MDPRRIRKGRSWALVAPRLAVVALVAVSVSAGVPWSGRSASAGNVPNQEGPSGTPPWRESPGGYVGDNGTPTPADWARDVDNIGSEIHADEAAPDVLVGDSITGRQLTIGHVQWADYFADRAVDAGIGGDTTQNVLDRLDAHRELSGATPETIILLIGTNDFHHGWTAPQVTAGVVRVMRTLHAIAPAANVVDVSLLPKYTTADPEWDDVTAVDAALGEQVPTIGGWASYLDVWPDFVTTNADGSQEQTPGLFNDLQVHPTAQGYEVLDQALCADPLIGSPEA